MNEPRPRRWAVSTVNAATLLLPPGAVRRRYRAELVSELWGMTTAQQLSHALSILVSAPSLHRALVEAGDLDVPHSPLWCRLHLHHSWRRFQTEDRTHFRRCVSCGLDDDETSRRSSPTGEAFGMTGVHPN